MKTIDKQSYKEWEEFHKNILKAISVDDSETAQQKLARIARLEKDPEAWFVYYFPNYARSKPALFHKRATRRILENKRWFELRMWSRELAKSTRTMMEVVYLTLAKKELRNVILISNSQDNAERLLLPYKINLQSNPRINADYGAQQALGTWASYEFITRLGVSFRALGAGQSPRGTRFENHRVDCILVDDIDTDVDCRNPRIIKEKFKWLQEAVIPTVSISGDYRIIICGNKISRDCIVTYSEKLANFIDTVNIRDKNGQSSWIEKNSQADIDRILSLISYASAQKEYFNNPIVEGTIFTEMSYKEIRPLSDYKFLVCYTDPSFKDTKKNDYKATVLVGKYKDEFHIIKAFCEQTTTAMMIDWHYQIDTYVKDRAVVFYLMEANFIQDTLLTEFYKTGQTRDKVIPIKGDTRKKPDKFTRIEALLEPLNRNGKLWLNKYEKDNKHMQRLEEQFLTLEPGSSAHDDAPDAVEGAIFNLNRRSQLSHLNSMQIRNKKTSSKKY